MNNIEELEKKLIDLCIRDNGHGAGNKRLFNSVHSSNFIRKGYSDYDLYPKTTPFKQCIFELGKNADYLLRITPEKLSWADMDEQMGICVGNALDFVEIKFPIEILNLENVKDISFKNCIFSGGLMVSDVQLGEKIIFDNCYFPKNMTLKNVKSDYLCFQSGERVETRGFRSDLATPKVEGGEFSKVQVSSQTYSGLELKYHAICKDGVALGRQVNKVNIFNCDVKEFVWQESHFSNPQVSVGGGVISSWRVGNDGKGGEHGDAPKWRIKNTSVEKIEFDAGDALCDLEIERVEGVKKAADKTLVQVKGRFDKLSIEKTGYIDMVKLSNVTTEQQVLSLKSLDVGAIYLDKITPSKRTNPHPLVYGLLLEFSDVKSTREKGVKVHIKDIDFEDKVLFKDIELGSVILDAVEFKETVEFAGVEFNEYPGFYEKNFSDKCHVQFSNCNFEKWFLGDIDNSSNAEEFFRSMKNQSIKTNYEYGEHLFTALELKARNRKLKQNDSEKWLGRAGWKLNKFGISLMQPFWWWLATMVGITIFYYGFGLVKTRATSNIFCDGDLFLKDIWPSFLYSFENALFFTKVLLSEKCYYPTIGGYFLGIFQMILSAVLLYLFITGVKKRFRQK